MVVRDELRGESLVTVGESTQLREQFDAITTLERRMERLERPPAFPVASPPELWAKVDFVGDST